MNDLSDDAKALFDAARQAQEPTERDRELVRTAVLIRIGGAAATLGAAKTGTAATLGQGTAATLGQGTALASGGKVLLALKLVIGLTVAGGTGTLAYHSLAPGTGASEASIRSRAAVGLAASNAPALASASRPQLSRDVDQQSNAVGSAVTSAVKPLGAETKPTSRRSPVRLDPSAAPRVAAPELENRSSPAGAIPGAGAFPGEPAKSSDLSLEARALSLVQRAVREGRSGEALTLLDQQERDFPQGELRQERVAARAVALCAAGRVSEARALAASFLARAPRSPLAARMRSICTEEPTNVSETDARRRGNSGNEAKRP
jgi:hypothetical protein